MCVPEPPKQHSLQLLQSLWDPFIHHQRKQHIATSFAWRLLRKLSEVMQGGAMAQSCVGVAARLIILYTSTLSCALSVAFGIKGVQLGSCPTKALGQ